MVEDYTGFTFGHMCESTEIDKHATWGASQHLQERLANVRTLRFSMS